MSIGIQTFQQVVPPTYYPGLPYQTASSQTLRVDFFVPRLPFRSLATPSYVVRQLSSIALEGEGLPQFAFSLVESPTTVSPARNIYEVRFSLEGLHYAEGWQDTFLQTAQEEVRCFLSAALVYGAVASPNAAWGWPFSSYDVEAYPAGLFSLSGSLDRVVNTDGSSLTLELLSGALSYVPWKSSRFFVMNETLLQTYIALWDTAGHPVPLWQEPLTGVMLPSYAGVPILLNNFISIANGESGHPEGGTADRTSMYLVSFETLPGQGGLFGLYPASFPQKPYTVEVRQDASASDLYIARFALEYALAWTSAADIVRLSSLSVA